MALILFNLSSEQSERVIEENRSFAEASTKQSNHDYVTICQGADDRMQEDDASDQCSLSGPPPWFRTFTESIVVQSLDSAAKVSKAIADSRKMPESLALVKALAIRRRLLFEQQVASRKRALVQEFPFGIAGARASLTKSPEAVKLCLFGHSQTTEAMGHSRLMADDPIGERVTRGRPKLSQLSRQASIISVDKHAVVPPVDVSLFRLRAGFKDTTRLREVKAVDDLESAATWTYEEVVNFLRSYATSPKDFKRIAASIPDKTPTDCVDFYYRYKQVLGLKFLSTATSGGVRRKTGEPSARQVNPKIFVDTALAVLAPHVTFGDVLPRDTFRKLPLIETQRRDPRWPGEDEEERKLIISCLLANETSRDFLLNSLMSYYQAREAASMANVAQHSEEVLKDSQSPELARSEAERAEVISLCSSPMKLVDADWNSQPAKSESPSHAQDPVDSQVIQVAEPMKIDPAELSSQMQVEEEA